MNSHDKLNWNEANTGSPVSITIMYEFLNNFICNRWIALKGERVIHAQNVFQLNQKSTSTWLIPHPREMYHHQQVCHEDEIFKPVAFHDFFLFSKQKLKNDNELVQMTYILNGSFLLLHLASLPLLGWLLCCTHGCIMYIDFQFYVQFLHYCTFTTGFF